MEFVGSAWRLHLGLKLSVSIFSCLAVFSVLAESVLADFLKSSVSVALLFKILHFIIIDLKIFLYLIFIPLDELHRKFLVNQDFLYHLSEKRGLYTLKKDIFAL